MTGYNIIDRKTGDVIGTAATLNGARRVVREENACNAGRYGYRAA